MNFKKGDFVTTDFYCDGIQKIHSINGEVVKLIKESNPSFVSFRNIKFLKLFIFGREGWRYGEQ